MSLVDAVRNLPPEPSGATWPAGLTAADITAFTIFRETGRCRVKSACSPCRAGPSDLTTHLGKLRARLRRVEPCGPAGNFCTGHGLNRRSGGPVRIGYAQRLNTSHGRRRFAPEAICAADGTVVEIKNTGRDIARRREAHKQHLAAHAAAQWLRRRHQRFRRALARGLLLTGSRLAHPAGYAVPSVGAPMPRLAAVRDCPAFEGERVNVTCQPFEPRRVIAGAVSALADEAPSVDCGIASVIAAEVPRRVTADPALLRQVIERLAGPPLGDGNGICIRISAEAGRLLLTFETPWPRLPGQSAAPSDTALAAVRPVIEAMGGELALRHSNGAASVWVEIPAPAAGETAGDAERGAAGNRPSPGTGPLAGRA